MSRTSTSGHEVTDAPAGPLARTRGLLATPGSWRRLVAVLALPLVLAAAAGVLTAFELNGSSLAQLSTAPTQDPDLVAGTPRAVRSDEFRLASPAQVGNALKDSPPHTWLGLTDTNFAVTSLGVGTTSWTAIFQPQTWPLIALPVSLGFAARWWFVIAVGVIGVYALLMALRPRISVAVPMAVAVGFSPLAAWWSSPSPGAVVGFLAGAGAALVLANRAQTRARTVGLGLLAGYLACAALFVLYPPWQVSVGLVVAAAVVGDAIQRRVPWRRFAVASGSALVLFGGVAVAWLLQSADDLRVITATNYPGSRVSEAGEGSPAILFSAPLNGVVASDDSHLVVGRWINASEVASGWFPLPVLIAFAAVAVILAVRRRSATGAPVASGSASGGPATADPTDSASRRWASAIAVAAALTLLVSWMLLPVPAFVGRLTLLDRVPSGRTTLAIALAVGLLVHLCAGRLRIERHVLAWAVAAAGVLACGPLVLWSASRLLDPGVPGVAWALVTGVVVAACFAALLFVRGTVWPAAAVLVLVVFANWAVVNPLYRGLGPLTDGALATTLRATAEAEGPTRWVSLAGSPVTSVIMASPQTALSGLTYYPTEEVWSRLAPTQRRLWNNYVKYTWIHDSAATPASIRQVNGTNMELRIDLCSPEVDFLDISYVVTRTPDPTPPCFETVTSLRDLGGQPFTVSRRE